MGELNQQCSLCKAGEINTYLPQDLNDFWLLLQSSLGLDPVWVTLNLWLFKVRSATVWMPFSRSTRLLYGHRFFFYLSQWLPFMKRSKTVKTHYLCVEFVPDSGRFFTLLWLTPHTYLKKVTRLSYKLRTAWTILYETQHDQQRCL